MIPRISNRSLEGLLEELSDLNRVHMGLAESGMTRSYKAKRYLMLLRELEEHQREAEEK